MLVYMPETEPELWEGGGRRYRMEKVVGNGAFGVVWRAVEEVPEPALRLAMGGDLPWADQA